METGQRIEVAYPRKFSQVIIIRLARPINKYLVKIVGFDFPAPLRQHFKCELRNWFTEIQAIRLKPTMRTGSFRFYFDPLFDYSFGGVEVQNMRGLVDLISREHETYPTKTPEQLARWIERFHTGLAERLHRGEAVLDMIPE
jgi:hypothetical protein